MSRSVESPAQPPRVEDLALLGKLDARSLPQCVPAVRKMPLHAPCLAPVGEYAWRVRPSEAQLELLFDEALVSHMDRNKAKDSFTVCVCAREAFDAGLGSGSSRSAARSTDP